MKFTQEIKKTPEEDKYYALIREEVIQNINDNNVISRNHYGALVLNSTSTLFIDCDVDKGSSKEKLLTRIKEDILDWYDNYNHECIGEDPEDIEPPLNFRVYETFNGYRILVSGRVWEVGENSTDLMENFNSDMLYMFLCEKQQCYRARLTPKPLRAGINDPRITLRSDPKEVKKWIKKYNKVIKKYKTCKLVHEYSNINFSIQEQKVIKIHDKYCKINYKNLPLA